MSGRDPRSGVGKSKARSFRRPFPFLRNQRDLEFSDFEPLQLRNSDAITI
jgi:hypothetical protein